MAVDARAEKRCVVRSAFSAALVEVVDDLVFRDTRLQDQGAADQRLGGKMAVKLIEGFEATGGKHRSPVLVGIWKIAQNELNSRITSVTKRPARRPGAGGEKGR